MGHVILKNGLSPGEDKIAAINKTREPTTATEVHSVLGLVNFCSKFIPNSATIAEPLRECTRTGYGFK